MLSTCTFFFFQAEDGIRDVAVTGVQTCALPISDASLRLPRGEELSADPVRARRTTLELRQRLLPRDASARRAGILGLARQPTRLHRIRTRVHLRLARALGHEIGRASCKERV